MVLVNYSWYRDACKVWWYVCSLFPHAGWSIFVFRWNWICFPTKLDLLWCMLSHVIDGTRYVKVPWYIVTQLTRLVAVVSISLEWFFTWNLFHLLHLIVFIQTQNGWPARLWARVFRFLQVASVEDRADFFPLWCPSWGCSRSRHQPPPDVGGGPKRGDPDSNGWFDR